MATILIVDDDPIIVQFVRQALAHHDVHAVDHGDDVMEALWRVRPDLLLLDCGLPGRGGMTLLGDIRRSAAFATLPIAILTARRSEWHAQSAISQGAQTYIRKPFVPAELRAEVEALLVATAIARPAA